MNERILVVDDEVEIVELLTDYLRAEGYRVTIASNGREALDKAGAEKPDLVILDIMMPDLDGFEVCRRLRANSGVPVSDHAQRQAVGGR